MILSSSQTYNTIPINDSVKCRQQLMDCYIPTCILTYLAPGASSCDSEERHQGESGSDQQAAKCLSGSSYTFWLHEQVPVGCNIADLHFCTVHVINPATAQLYTRQYNTSAAMKHAGISCVPLASPPSIHGLMKHSSDGQINMALSLMAESPLLQSCTYPKTHPLLSMQDK